MAKVSISFKGVACIYAVKSPTGKIYIGQTWDLYHRYKSGVSKSQRLLYRSYKKHGEENHKLFTIVQFVGAFTQQDLDYWERYYIEVYRADGCELLNIREGGGNKGKLDEETKRLIALKSKAWKEANPDKVKEIQSKAAMSNIGRKRSDETKKLQSEAAKGKSKTFEHCTNISLAKKGKPSPHKGKHFSPEAAERIRAAAKTRRQISKPVNQYSTDGIFVKEWTSIIEARRALKLNSSTTIIGCCLKKPNYKTCAGFIWRYKGDNTPIIPEDHKQTYNPKRRAVLQYHLNGNLIAQYETVKEAAIETSANRTCIIDVCQGKRKSAGGFIWKYK